MLDDVTLDRVRGLNEIAEERGQSLAQMALAWALRDPRMTSLVIGASSVKQLEENVTALDNLSFTDDELSRIDQFAVDSGINLWEVRRPLELKRDGRRRRAAHPALCRLRPCAGR